MKMVEEHVVIDGYYTRRDELHIRGTVIEESSDWQSRLKQSVESIGNSVRIDQSGSSLYLTIFAENILFQPLANVVNGYNSHDSRSLQPL